MTTWKYMKGCITCETITLKELEINNDYNKRRIGENQQTQIRDEKR